jgi:hypothetical protein
MLEQTVTTSYVSNPSDVAASTATNQNDVQMVTTTSTNPSVTRVEL